MIIPFFISYYNPVGRVYFFVFCPKPQNIVSKTGKILFVEFNKVF
jgi:hypothetical protein